MMNILLAAERAEKIVETQESESAIKWLFILIGFCVIIYFFYQYGLKKKSEQSIKKEYDTSSFEEEFCEGELKFDDVVAYFKVMSLNPENDVPLMERNPSDVFGGSIVPQRKFEKEGYVSLLLGVYNKKEDTLSGKFVYSKTLDPKIIEIFGDDNLVTLS